MRFIPRPFKHPDKNNGTGRTKQIHSRTRGVSVVTGFRRKLCVSLASSQNRSDRSTKNPLDFNNDRITIPHGSDGAPRSRRPEDVRNLSHVFKARTRVLLSWYMARNNDDVGAEVDKGLWTIVCGVIPSAAA